MAGNIEPTVIFDCREFRSNQQTAQYRYGITDPEGRDVGCSIMKFDVYFVIEQSVTNWEHDLFRTRERAETILAKNEERGLFGLWNQQTRDGRPYGASQSCRYFRTREEREAAISKYLKQGRVTAEKSVAKRAAQKAADAAWRKQTAERRKGGE